MISELPGCSKYSKYATTNKSLTTHANPPSASGSTGLRLNATTERPFGSANARNIFISVSVNVKIDRFEDNTTTRNKKKNKKLHASLYEKHNHAPLNICPFS